jgi:hypothetical protein
MCDRETAIPPLWPRSLLAEQGMAGDQLQNCTVILVGGASRAMEAKGDRGAVLVAQLPSSADRGWPRHYRDGPRRTQADKLDSGLQNKICVLCLGQAVAVVWGWREEQRRRQGSRVRRRRRGSGGAGRRWRRESGEAAEETGIKATSVVLGIQRVARWRPG